MSQWTARGSSGALGSTTLSVPSTINATLFVFSGRPAHDSGGDQFSDFLTVVSVVGRTMSFISVQACLSGIRRIRLNTVLLSSIVCSTTRASSVAGSTVGLTSEAAAGAAGVSSSVETVTSILEQPTPNAIDRAAAASSFGIMRAMACLLGGWRS